MALLAMSAVMALLSSPVAGQSEYYDSCNPRAKRVDCGDVGTTQEEVSQPRRTLRGHLSLRESDTRLLKERGAEREREEERRERV